MSVIPGQGVWPLEPATFFTVFYYPTNGASEEPSFIDFTMRDYNSAVERAKELITSNNNEGICAINPVTSFILYPYNPWEDF